MEIVIVALIVVAGSWLWMARASRRDRLKMLDSIEDELQPLSPDDGPIEQLRRLAEMLKQQRRDS